MPDGNDPLLSKMRKSSPFFNFTENWIKRFCGVKTIVGKPLDADGYVLSGSSGEERPDLHVDFGLPMYKYMHEVAHSWLARMEGLYSNQYDYSLNRMPPNALMGKCELYTSLTNKIRDILAEEGKFGSASNYFMPENRKNRGATAKRLDALFGEPLLYDNSHPSWLSNILGESKIFSKDAGGHPLDSFTEFFASTMATFTFDGETAFSRLKALLVLRNDPKYAAIADSFFTVLSFSAKYGTEMSGQMLRAGGNALPEIRNLAANMQKLQLFLQEWEKAKQKPAATLKN